jgi:hypothetical protein
MPEETYDPHKTATEIRQGSPRRMNLRVLLISGSLAVLLLAAVYIAGYFPFTI